jgi:hypothetical protein
MFQVVFSGKAGIDKRYLSKWYILLPRLYWLISNTITSANCIRIRKLNDDQNAEWGIFTAEIIEAGFAVDKRFEPIGFGYKQL